MMQYYFLGILIGVVVVNIVYINMQLWKRVVVSSNL